MINYQVFILFFVYYAYSLKTYGELLSCVKNRKCLDITNIEHHQITNRCVCHTDQDLSEDNLDEEIKIKTIKQMEQCFDDCKSNLTASQREAYMCIIECCKDDDYYKQEEQGFLEKYYYMFIIIAVVVLVVVCLFIWRFYYRKKETTQKEQQIQYPKQHVQYANQMQYHNQAGGQVQEVQFPMQEQAKNNVQPNNYGGQIAQ